MSKSSEILRILEEKLLRGDYPPGSKFPSERQLALHYGIGRNTANRAIAELIHSGRLEHGVRGSGTRVCRRGADRRKRIVFMGKFLHQHFTRVLHGALQSASSRNYELVLSCPAPDEVNLELEHWKGTDVIGLIVSGYDRLPADFPIPAVYIDFACGNYRTDCHNVVNRNHSGGSRMVRALLEAGHREIVLFANNDYRNSHRRFRVQGMLDALSEAGITDGKQRLFTAMEQQVFDISPIIRRIYQRFPAVTAIAAVSDDLALKLLVGCKKLDIAPPPVITGFGNVTNISNIYNLPTVDQHAEQLGARATEILMDLYEGAIPPTPVMEYVDVDLLNLDSIPRLV